MSNFRYRSTKTYGPEQGLSACFRQWRATHSHCSKLHGYALGFKFVFGANLLDDLNWVMDFGALKPLKDKLMQTFDHKLVVAGDDPALHHFKQLQTAGLADVLMFPHGVGCEKFAEAAWHMADEVVRQHGRETDRTPGRVQVLSAECFEHAGNSAIFLGPVQ